MRSARGMASVSAAEPSLLEVLADQLMLAPAKIFPVGDEFGIPHLFGLTVQILDLRHLLLSRRGGFCVRVVWRGRIRKAWHLLRTRRTEPVRC